MDGDKEETLTDSKIDSDDVLIEIKKINSKLNSIGKAINNVSDSIDDATFAVESVSKAIWWVFLIIPTLTGLFFFGLIFM